MSQNDAGTLQPDWHKIDTASSANVPHGRSQPIAGFRSLALEDIKMRAEMASRLAEAIGDAHPDDASQLMTAALMDLSAGNPGSSIFISAEEDAQWWASIATPAELMAVMTATLQRLGDRSLHRDMRKRLFLKLWQSFEKDEQERFLTFARGEV